MTDLILVKDKTPLTTSLAIAEGTEQQHASVIKLVRKYKTDLKEFGLLGFEIRPRTEGQHGGGDTEYVLLNEPQATLLLTYMSNTPVVRQFKKKLVRAFYDMAEQIRGESRVSRVEFEHNRARRLDNPHGIDIKYSLDLTKIVMQPNQKGLQVLTRLTGIDLDDIAESLQPAYTAPRKTVEAFISACCIQEPGCTIGATDLYQAFQRWNEGSPLSQKAFGSVMKMFFRSQKAANGHKYIDLRLVEE